MWEAIAANRFRSRLLILVMGILLVALGFAIGGLVDPQLGAPIGAIAAVGIWLVCILVALYGGGSIMLSTAGAREIQKSDAPQLWNIVEEMTIAAGLGKMPRVYVVEDYVPNAFAVGHSPNVAAVAVTTGLLKRLNRDELQGVVAHEIGHIVNRDTRFITMAAVLMGTIVMISDMFLRSLRFAGGRGRTSGRGKNGGQAAAVLFLIALALAILAPILARLLYFACSRRREYLADASGALFTRYPEGLASALEKIARRSDLSTNANRTLAPLCTVNPLQGFSASGLFSTHPPTDLRIRVLRGMAGGAGYVDYDSAFKKVLDRTSGCIGPRTLGAARPAPVRGPSAAGIAPAAGETPPAAEVGGLLDRLANYTLIPCACGLKIKIPPALKMASVTCPRCGKHHRVPAATAKGETGTETPGGPGAAPEAEQPGAEVLPPLQYQRRSKGWESFRCACGHTLQVSPEFVATHLDCPKCRRHIEIS